jgi:acetyltransferase-like isoleucine patch superfamily enzyme
MNTRTPLSNHRQTPMEENSVIHELVTLGSDAAVGDFCAIGVPPRGCAEGELATVVGERATFQSHAILYAGNVIGDDFEIGHGSFIRESNVIGDRVSVGALNIWEGRVTVGNDVTIGSQTGIGELAVIGNGVVIGAQVGLAAVLHPLSSEAKKTGGGASIADGVTIGTGVSISPGVRLGEGAYVQSGAMVVRDVPPCTVVAGSPAKPIGDVWELHPEVMDRLSRYFDTSAESIAKLRAKFAELVRPASAP